MYLVDTSLWIDFLRNKPTPAALELERLIHLGDVVINDIIFNEICHGAKDIHQFRKYKKYFGQIPHAALGQWKEEVADMRYLLKTKGITASLADSLIAFSCIKNKLTLLTKDLDFKPFKVHCHLSLVLL